MEYGMILIVDSDAGVRSALHRTLTDQGHGVIEATDAAEAVHAMNTVRVDLVLTGGGLTKADDLALRDWVAAAQPGASVLSACSHALMGL
jgi:DNA-binding NtrC family response regulator